MLYIYKSKKFTMKIFKPTSFIICLLLSLFAVASDHKDKSVLDNDNNFSAEYKTKYTLVENYIVSQKYLDAIPILLQLDSVTPLNPNIYYYLGICYLNSSNDKSKAIPYLEKASEKVSTTYKASYSENTAPIKTLYYLGKAYHISGRYEEAIKAFKAYKDKLPKKDPAIITDVDSHILMCHNAIKLVKSPRNLKIELFNPDINTKNGDYSFAISSDKSILIFASDVLDNSRNNKTFKYNQELYITAYNKKSRQWLRPAKIESEIKSIATDNVFSTRSDTKEVFISKDYDDNKDLYSVTFKSNKTKGIIEWSDIQKVTGAVNTKANETNACLSPDGSTLYFVSDREGGLGGKDIWASDKLSDGSWGKPYNLGPKINTPFDEESPFMLGDGATLYYSSKGHNSMGGYDVFFTTLSDDGFWSESENVGYPINTPTDDLYFVLTPDEKSAFYSSSKIDGIGDNDIYVVEFE